MKKQQKTTYHKKVTSKRRGKNQASHAFTYTRIFSKLSNFFVGAFLQFPQKVMHLV